MGRKKFQPEPISFKSIGCISSVGFVLGCLTTVGIYHSLNGIQKDQNAIRQRWSRPPSDSYSDEYEGPHVISVPTTCRGHRVCYECTEGSGWPCCPADLLLQMYYCADSKDPEPADLLDDYLERYSRLLWIGGEGWGNYYYYIAELGAGSYGAVVEMWDRKGKAYAVKFMFKGGLTARRLQKAQERWSHELDYMLILKDCPNVVEALSWGENDHAMMIRMNLAQGSVRDFLSEEHGMDEKIVRHIMHDLLTALAAAHAKRIVHLDVKPRNTLVMVDDNGGVTYQLGDWGLSMMMQEDEDELYVSRGTRGYKAPEMINFDNPDEEYAGSFSDVYSAGVTMFRCLTGNHHDPEVDQRSLIHADDIMPELARDLVLWMTEDDPDDRPRAADALHHQWFDDFEPAEAPVPL